ncbi:MAG: hypothetical protein PHF70_11885 [Opitutales bacterium]|nr:hypothetical protein [Opitutales bacterium]
MKTWMLAVVVMLSGGMASGAEVRLYAEDGTYLGKAGASPYDAESIDNPYGIYGSQYSPTSIRNPYGKYGIQSNQIGPVVRRQVTPIPRPAESAMDGFWKRYRQGYDSVERMAQRRREQQAEHERWMQDMREQDARDNELAAIREQTREIRELRLALEAQRYQQQAKRTTPAKNQDVSAAFDNLSDEEKARMRRNLIILFGGDPNAEEADPQKETQNNGSPFTDDFLELIGYTPPETAEEKAARLKEEGRREWEAIKAQGAAEDAKEEGSK